jgi:hypothetical protein
MTFVTKDKVGLESSESGGDQKKVSMSSDLFR